MTLEDVLAETASFGPCHRSGAAEHPEKLWTGSSLAAIP